MPGMDHGAKPSASSSASPAPSMGDMPGMDHMAAGNGLADNKDGYRLISKDTAPAAGRRATYRFAVTGPDGKPVTAFALEQTKRMHFYAIRSDLSGFQHVHPELDAGGTWSAPVDLTPGTWRVYADFQPAAGAAMTLGADLLVAGDFVPAAPRPDTRTSTVDGYTVTLDGDLTAGDDAVLTPRVSLDGREVTDELEPYLGALGHLVALRRGDLAYLHVHPDMLEFHTSVPSAGAYELFLDFQHGGVVRTAHFTLTAGAGHDHH